MAEQEEKWKKASIMAIAIGFLDLLVLFLGTSKERFHIAWSLGSIGVITFLGILMLANYLSDSPTLDKGEMRKAITGSFIAVYFALVSLLTFTGFSPSSEKLAETIIGHFTYLVGIVVVFYFGSSGVREYLKFKERRQNSEEEEKKPKGKKEQPVSDKE
ncbi:hypothetical protein E3J48_03600 [Candidatus Aerophobetes bacterium]|uniref:Uncharacterized protein n=1 Tax=Aerophobetes bacterium TaxID=2030807 RepID=A0A523W781_UNCAE|nr:MAG: hypothetical protein E3J48_03600 [Candidatus Aerophobetes bacterium]